MRAFSFCTCLRENKHRVKNSLQGICLRRGFGQTIVAQANKNLTGLNVFRAAVEPIIFTVMHGDQLMDVGDDVVALFGNHS
jgi:hypothetical protein